MLSLPHVHPRAQWDELLWTPAHGTVRPSSRWTRSELGRLLELVRTECGQLPVPGAFRRHVAGPRLGPAQAGPDGAVGGKTRFDPTETRARGRLAGPRGPAEGAAVQVNQP